jgi:uncharacterized protein YndB with AHSA1/START domain
MDRALKVEKVVIIKAGPDEVWKALTDKESIKKYFFGTEAISDWEVGSSLIFQGEWEGKTYQDKGTILAADAGKLLQYNYWSGFSGLEDMPENYSLVTYRLSSELDQCTLTLTQEGFAGEEAKAHSEGGWTMVLDNLKKLLE